MRQGDCMSNEDVKSEIKSVLDNMAKAFVTKDVELYMSLYDSEPDLIIYGSQSGEKWTVLRDFKEAVVHNWQMLISGHTKLNIKSTPLYGILDTYAWKSVLGPQI